MVIGQMDLFSYIKTMPKSQEDILDSIKKRIEERGYKADWVSEIPDLSDKGACFLKKGKRHYKSPCEKYEGYWLKGGFGAVQCSCAGIIPGVLYDELCATEDKMKKCPHFKEVCK